MMRRHTGRLETGTMLATLGKIFVAGAVLAAVCLVSQQFLFPSSAHQSQWKLIVEMLLTIVVGARIDIYRRLFAENRGSP